MGLAATTLVLSASALAATPTPEPTPEAKAVPKPDPAPSGYASTSQTRGSNVGRVTARPHVVAPRPVRVVRAPVQARPQTRSRLRTRSHKSAAPARRSVVSGNRGASPASAAPVERRAPRNPPLRFVSAPVLFPDEGGAGMVFAALALLALCAASASHLGLLYTVWKRAPV